jgi:hypothetical protein
MFSSIGKSPATKFISGPPASALRTESSRWYAGCHSHRLQLNFNSSHPFRGQVVDQCRDRSHQKSHTRIKNWRQNCERQKADSTDCASAAGKTGESPDQGKRNKHQPKTAVDNARHFGAGKNPHGLIFCTVPPKSFNDFHLPALSSSTTASKVYDSIFDIARNRIPHNAELC